jgi:iron complex outermembrane recepter protein
MKNQTPPIVRPVYFPMRTVLSVAISMVLPALAAAQTTTAAPATEEAQKVERVEVTGSRIRSLEVSSGSPVSTLGKTDLELSRALSVEKTLTQLPQFQGSFGANTNGADSRGAATLDLRGLGQNRSLTLIDGKRAAPFGFRNSADLNTLPAPLIKRVEVLTGGAAAVYGADAVAGVVNFILNDRFEGLEASVTANASTKWDALEKGVNLTAGARLGDRGGMTGYIGYSARDGLINRDRDFSATERNDAGPLTSRPVGGVFTRTDNASVFDLSGFGGAAGQPRLSFNDAGNVSSTAVTSLLRDRKALITPNERLSGAAFFNYDLTNNVEAYGRLMGSQTLAEERLVPANSATQILIQRNNPFLTSALSAAFAGAYNLTSAGAAGGTDAFRATLSRSYPEFGDTVLDTDRNNYQLMAGLRGEPSKNLRWDIYAQYGETREKTRITGDGLVARLQQAANATLDASGKAVCVDQSNGCAPINLFGPGKISAEALAFITRPFEQSRVRDQAVLGATMNANSDGMFRTAAGVVDAVFGVEYRRESGNLNFETALQTGQTLNQGARANFGGAFNTKELFTEVRVPLLKNVPFARALSVDGAYRYSKDSTAGSGDAWKAGADWEIENGLRVRGSYQAVVRAPNIGERFGALSSVALLGRATDPCANVATSGANAALCAKTGAPASPYTADIPASGFFFGGSANIKAEQGKTFTIGGVFAPRNNPDLNFTADYYDIKINNAISAFGAQAVLNFCYLSGIQLFCDKIRRGSNGQLVSIDSTDSNLAQLRVSGFDVGASYRFREFGGKGNNLLLAYTADIVTRRDVANGPGAPVLECAGKFGPTCGIETNRAIPKYSHRFTATYGQGPWTAQLAWRHVGKVTDDAATVYTVEQIGAKDYFDLSASWKVSKSLKVVFGIDNVLDKKPPQVFTQQTFGNTVPISYDVIGRRIGMSLTYTM